MAYTRVTLVVRGLTKEEVNAGLPDFLDEFKHRPWLINAEALWNASLRGLVVSTDYEGEGSKLCGAAVLDEIRDCVVACFRFSSDVHFETQNLEKLS